MRSGEQNSPPRMQKCTPPWRATFVFPLQHIAFFPPCPPTPTPDAAGSVKCVVFQKPAALAQKVWYVEKIAELFRLLYVLKVVAYIVTSESRQSR